MSLRKTKRPTPSHRRHVDSPLVGDVAYIVCYARIADDKGGNVRLSGVYFGGAANDRDGAETAARECINNIRGGTIMAKYWITTGPGECAAVMEAAQKHYLKLESQMILNREIITRTANRK